MSNERLNASESGDGDAAVATVDVEREVVEVIVEELQVEPSRVVREAHLVELGCDSLSAVEIVMEMEDRFGLSISDEDADGLKQVGQIIDYIKQRLAGGGEKGSA